MSRGSTKGENTEASVAEGLARPQVCPNYYVKGCSFSNWLTLTIRPAKASDLMRLSQLLPLLAVAHLEQQCSSFKGSWRPERPVSIHLFSISFFQQIVVSCSYIAIISAVNASRTFKHVENSRSTPKVKDLTKILYRAAFAF